MDKLYKFIVCILCLYSTPAQAEKPTHRGFNLSIGSDVESHVNKLSEFWGVNLVRLNLEFDAVQDDVENMEQYYEKLLPLLDRFEDLMPLLCDSGIKVVASLYSTPGGFETRAGGGLGNELPQSKVFVHEWAQEGLKDTWKVITERLKGNHDCIYAYDLMNEPAIGNFTAEGLKNWYELSAELVQIIRAEDPTTQIIVKTPYASPNTRYLNNIPDFDGQNVILGVHLYPHGLYAHQGIYDIPLGITPPPNRRIVRQLAAIARFMHQQNQRMNRGEISALPKLNVGEFAVVRWAPGAADYLHRHIALIENDINRRPFFGKPRRQLTRERWRVVRRIRRSLQRHVRFASWTFHAYGEATLWDPRFSDDINDNTMLEEPALTTRGEVLKKYFDRNN